MPTNTELVQQLYVAYFNRPGDVAGLDYYVGLLDRAGDPAATLALISADFAGSGEYTGAYGSLSARAAVNLVYENLFGHAADLAGLNYWATLYDAGTVTLDDVVTAIAAGAQGTDKVAYDDKVVAAAAFTAAIALSATQTLVYAGSAAAVDAGGIFLSGVTDAASLAAALAGIDNAAAGVVLSAQHVLTTAVDHLTGSVGNDVFYAYELEQHAPSSTPVMYSLNPGDTIDGGAGIDTLNVYVSSTANAGTLAAMLNSIEIVNIINDASATPAAIDAAALDASATQIWQVGQAAAITNLAEGTIAGFKNIGTDVSVAAAATASSAAIILRDFSDVSATAGRIFVSGARLDSLTLSGNLLSADGSRYAASFLYVKAGLDVTTFSLNSSLKDVWFSLDETYGTKHITTVDLSGSTGVYEYEGSIYVQNIIGGVGDDALWLYTATAAASGATAAINAVLNSGAGDDNDIVVTTGTGATTVNAGSGDDRVNIAAVSDGKLSVDMGAGNDVFLSSAIFASSSIIDGGDGVDTVDLSHVDAGNIGAIRNFEIFMVDELDHALDVSQLALRNTVTEFVSSWMIYRGAELDNLGAGVGFRFSGSLVPNAIILSQAIAGALTVTVDVDEFNPLFFGSPVDVAAIASNSTALNVVFDADFVGAAESATDNVANLMLTGVAASVLSVASGGTEASNVLVYKNSTAQLTDITITGERHLALTVLTTGASKLAGITDTGGGGLAMSTDGLAAGATITLGGGADLIDVTGASSAAGVVSLVHFAQGGADRLHFAGSAGVAADAGGSGYQIAHGVLSFTGAAPASLSAAVALAAAAVAGNAVVAFQYLDSSYVLLDNHNDASDTVIRLTGVTGLTGLAEDAAHAFFIV